jgi:hypothetical protein
MQKHGNYAADTAGCGHGQYGGQNTIKVDKPVSETKEELTSMALMFWT